MTAKEYLKQAYLLNKQIQVKVKELEQLRDMRGTIQIFVRRLILLLKVWKLQRKDFCLNTDIPKMASIMALDRYLRNQGEP